MSATHDGPRWSRTAPMGPAAPHQEETWTRHHGDLTTAFTVRVRTGKPLDVLGLRPIDPDEARAAVAGLADTAERLRAAEGPPLTACPCCAAPAAGAPVALTVTGIAYRRCPGCGHLFVGHTRDAAAVARHLAEDEDLAGVYTDTASLEVRLREVVGPKLDWVRDTAAAHGRAARSVIDLGAGAGHFVAVAHRAGLDARGVEISGPACRFARDVLGVELTHGDVRDIPAPDPPGDIVTLWGVLEYVADPLAFLAHARRFMRGDGLLVVEVPRADGVSSAVQAAFPGTVWRHLEPTSHVNVFSDASLMELLWRAGFAPVAAWAFGMDAYELVCQVALRTPSPPQELVTGLLALQDCLDGARANDDIIVAAVPR